MTQIKWEKIMYNTSLFRSLIMVSGILSSIVLIVSPMLVGALATFSQSIDGISLLADPLIAILVVLSMFGAFFGGMLFVFIVRKYFERLGEKSSNKKIQPTSYVGG
jgi:hypothetical protein